MRLLIILLMCCLCSVSSAAVPASPNRARPADIRDLLPNEFLFGTSWFGRHGDWTVETFQRDGIRWGLIYTYVFPHTSKVAGTEQIYIDWLIDKAKRSQSFPIFSMYGLLRLAEEKNLPGSEIEKVIAVCTDKEQMTTYFRENIRILKMIQSTGVYAIFHSEPDSWAFLQWEGSHGTHDSKQVPVVVSGTGLPELKGFPNTAAGMGKALLHLRDLYAPNVYMGFHCKDCRVGTNPELTVQFMRDLGQWDILIGDGIGHVYNSRSHGWWDTFSQERFDRYRNWYSTITREMKLPYIHWQCVVGKADFTLLEDYPNRQRVAEYVKMGSIGACFDLRIVDPDSFPSDANHGYSASPGPNHPANNTVAALIQRLKKYYQNPIRTASKTTSSTSSQEREEQRSRAAEKRVRDREAEQAKLDAVNAHRDAFQKRLQQVLDQQLDNQHTIRFEYSLLKKQVDIIKRSDNGYHLKGPEGMTMCLDIFTNLKADDAFGISLSLIRHGGEEAHAIAAYYAILCKDAQQARRLLAKAGENGESLRALLEQEP